jgi:hypothetical protein
MTTPARPGVFVTTTLTPLTTSTSGIPGEAIPAFALPYNRGPIGPVLIKSWPQFTKLYGNFSVANGSLLHYAVYQFFANNGNACYVLRCPNTDATYSTAALDGVGSDSAVVVATVKAVSPGVWGNQAPPTWPSSPARRRLPAARTAPRPRRSAPTSRRSSTRCPTRSST